MATLNRVLSIGYEFADPRVQNTKFQEPDSALGHDLIYWDPANLAGGYGVSKGDLDSKPLVEGAAVARFERDAERRAAEFREHLGAGKPMVVAIPPPRQLILTKDALGLGAGPFTPTQSIDVASLLPTEMNLAPARGKAFERMAGEPFAKFWKWAEPACVYESYFHEPPGTPLVQIAGTNRVVATAVQVNAGVILYLPRLLEQVVYADSDGNEIESDLPGENQAHVDFLNHVWELCRHFSGSVVVPDWSNAFQLPNESAAIHALSTTQARLSRVQSAIQKREQELRELRERKLLFTGTGPALERIVDRALTALGFEVEPGAPGRTDRVARRKRRAAVVEIKGKSKSASEKDAAQLEKWASDYHAEHGRSPKGILIVNAWRGKPLDEREDRAAFPDQMLEYAAEQRNQCLMTGLQLLGLWIEAEEYPGRRDKLALSILNCKGVFPRHRDWRDVLGLAGDEAA